MSEQPVAPPAQASRPVVQARPAGRENVLTHRLGPFPTWLWIVIIGGLIILWAWWKSTKAPGVTTQGNNATSGDAGVPQDQVPQFVNQTFTTVIPPTVSAPPVTQAVSPKTQGVLSFSWTQMGGQSATWSVSQLAQHLGISSAAIHGMNPAGQHAVQNPTKRIPMGAKFTYTKQPKTITSPEP